MEDATSIVEDATDYTEATTSHAETETSHRAPVTVEPPFAPAATSHEKMAKKILNSPFGNRMSSFENWVSSARKSDKLFSLFPF